MTEQTSIKSVEINNTIVPLDNIIFVRIIGTTGEDNNYIIIGYKDKSLKRLGPYSTNALAKKEVEKIMKNL